MLVRVGEARELATAGLMECRSDGKGFVPHDFAAMDGLCEFWYLSGCFFLCGLGLSRFFRSLVIDHRLMGAVGGGFLSQKCRSILSAVDSTKLLFTTGNSAAVSFN